MTSLLYRHPRIYRAVLRLLYGDDLARRERIVRAWIPAGARVVDVACGDAGIARRLPQATYVGVDVSPIFVASVRRRGFEAHALDVRRAPIPAGDVVLLLGALYQFLPDVDALLGRLRGAARLHAIVAEPYRNLAQSRSALVAALARRATDPGVESSTARLDRAGLAALFARHAALEVVDTGRELVARLPGGAS